MIRFLLVLWLMFSSSSALASCVPVFFERVARANSVPSEVVFALALQESATKMNNNKMMPWPYSLNYAGESFIYPSYKKMLLELIMMIRSGKTAVDVGFFQVNWKWHQERVKGIGYLAHPTVNSKVAMDILREQFEKYGDWVVAAGRYHNPNNNDGLADLYSERFEKWYTKVKDGYGC